MAFNFDIRDQKTQKLIMISLIPVVLLAGFYYLMIKPKLAEIEEKRTVVQKLNKDYQTTKNSLKSPAELNAEKENLEAEYQKLEDFLPDKENVAQLLDQLSDVEYKAKVYLVGFNATQTIEGNGKPYKANQYRVTIEAGYHQFAEFMSLIMSLPRIMSFSELRMSVNNELLRQQREVSNGPAELPRYLSIDCLLTSYVFSMGAVSETAEK